MADGPAIQAVVAARAQGRADAEPRRSTWCARFAPATSATPIVLMGYYNPIYIYGVDRFLADAKAGRRRRPHRRGPAAGGGRGAVPAGAQGRAQLHPPRDADHRRQAPARGAREHLGLRLLRLDHRHHRRGRARPRRRSSAAVARIKRHTKLPVAVGFGVRTAEQARARSRRGADGVVVGSALVSALKASLDRRRQGNGEDRDRGRQPCRRARQRRACAAAKRAAAE